MDGGDDEDDDAEVDDGDEEEEEEEEEAVTCFRISATAAMLIAKLCLSFLQLRPHPFTGHLDSGIAF